MERILAPSILSADFAHLADDLALAERGGAKYLHFDVMDGVFVPNISFGLPVLQAVRRVSKSVLDVHLMIIKPIGFIERFLAAGADILTLQLESDKPEHIIEGMRMIRSLNKKAGLAISPKTPLELALPLLELADLLLVMTVEPGFGGQKLIPEALLKVRAARAHIDSRALPCLLEVDGGVTAENAQLYTGAGADVVVAGSAVFDGRDTEAAARAVLLKMNA